MIRANIITIPLTATNTYPTAMHQVPAKICRWGIGEEKESVNVYINSMLIVRKDNIDDKDVIFIYPREFEIFEFIRTNGKERLLYWSCLNRILLSCSEFPNN